MNPLFIGLLIAGVALVLGVLVYNWAQERRLRGRRNQASAGVPAHPARDGGHGRAEPMLGVRGVEDEAMPFRASAVPGEEENPADAGESEVQAGDPLPSLLTPRLTRDDFAPDADIECVVWLTPERPVPTSALAQVLNTSAAKPVRWLGRIGPHTHWRAIDGTSAGPWQELAACLLLADRNGAASRDDLDAFLRAVDRVATSIGAQCVWPDERDEAGRADALDRLCADLDVQVGLTILKGESAAIAGTRLRGVAEASGFRLSSAGHFEYTHEETGAVAQQVPQRRAPVSVVHVGRNSVQHLADGLVDPRVAELPPRLAVVVEPAPGREVLDDRRTAAVP